MLRTCRCGLVSRPLSALSCLGSGSGVCVSIEVPAIDAVLAGIGRRVSVRRVVGSRDGRPLFSDVLGVLEAAGDSPTDDVVVRRRDRSVESFPRASVVAAKLVPAAGLRVSDRELEEIAALGWPGVETERLGDWLLRPAAGSRDEPTPPSPSATRACRSHEAVARVAQWYVDRGLPPRFLVPVPHAAALRPVSRRPAAGS